MNDYTELIASLHKGDHHAMREVFSHLSPALYGYALRVTESEDKAAQVLRNTFQQIWKGIAAFHGSSDSFYLWAFKLARQSAMELVQRESPAAPSFDFIAYQATQTGKSTLKELVEGWDEKHRKMIDLALLMNLSEAEIEEAMNIPSGIVSTRLRLAVRELRGLTR